MDEPGPFDQVLRTDPPPGRDRTATIIVALGIVLGALLLVLVLPPVSIFDSDDGPSATGTIIVAVRDELPPPPIGFEAVSALYDVSSTEQVGLEARPRLTIDLAVSVDDGVPLTLFSYREGSWTRLGDAAAVAGGSAAQGEVSILPDNVAVFRQAAQSRLLLGTLPAGEGIDPRASNALTTLNIGGYSPSASGAVVGDTGQPANTLGLPVAPTISATGGADAQAVNTILASAELQDAHVQAILAFAREGGYAGIDLDYRAIDPALTNAFTALVRDLSASLRAEGRTLTLTLPAPVQDGDGWNTLGYDWEALPALASAVKLVSTAEPDSYYESMKQALGFLTPLGIGGKLLLTVSPLSWERGVDGARELTLTDALAIASTPVTRPDESIAPGDAVVALGLNLADETGASSLRWDETARAVTFSYTGLGGVRTVWLANVFSAAFRLDLARRYQLGGIAIDDVSQRVADANLWPAVLQYAQSGEVALVQPNGALLQPSWSVSGGQLQSNTGPAVTWRVPSDAGTYTLTLVVSDGVMRVGQELRIPVQPRQQAVAP